MFGYIQHFGQNWNQIVKTVGYLANRNQIFGTSLDEEDEDDVTCYSYINMMSVSVDSSAECF